MEICNPAAAFLVAAGGNWRNALFIECKGCPKANSPGAGFLMIPGPDAKPILMDAEDVSRLLGCDVEKEECIATLTLAQFEKLYAAWLIWTVDDANVCCLRWLAKFGPCRENNS